MSSYRFKKSKKYRTRRFLTAVAVILCILAIVMGGYLFLNRDTAGNAPGNSTQSGANPSPASDSPGMSSTSTPSDQAANSTVPADPSIDLNGVETADYGFLPYFDSVEDSGKMQELEKLIKDTIAKFPGKYGITFIDLATGEMVNVNDKVEYIAASTSKLPINVLLYKNIEAGKVKPGDMLTYKEEDLEWGTGIIQQQPYGTQYTVRETSKLSLEKSDNCGINMLIRLLGIENVRNYIDEVGGQVHYGARHRSCPYDMGKIAEDLYKLYLNNEEVYGEMLRYMENTDWNDRINAKLPPEVKVAHKIGNQVKTANDVGIIFASHPYVLSVMTALNEDSEVGAAYNNIADLSRKIYDFVEAYAKK